MQRRYWQYAMMEEYDVWETIPKPTLDSMIDSKHASDIRIERK